jgi:hypothetical protein
MSNELAKFFENNPALVEQGLDEDTLAVAGGATKGSKRISIKGRVFRKIVGGKEVSVNEENWMNVIFVKMAHEASRTCYEGAYREGEKTSPSCWSSDSKKPDPSVPTPAAASCDNCPNSVKGSGQGGNGTKCKLSWRTAVVLPNDPAGDVYQLVLPAMSAFGKEENGRWPFRPFIQMLANNNVSAGKIITKMQFDIKAPVPRVLFSPAQAVPPELKDTIMKQSKSMAAESAIKLTVFQADTTDEVEAPALAEPVKRESVKKAAVEPVEDATEIIKKWTKK